MPTSPVVLSLAALLLGVSGSPSELPAEAEVVAASLGAFVAPDPTSVAPERLRRGTRVRVVDVDEVSGWLTIEPPSGAFSWVDRKSIRTENQGRGRVVEDRTVVRAGVPNARLPGPPRAVLDRGATVRLLDRPPLSVGRGPAASTWLAIAPTPGEVRYVRAESVTWLKADPAPTPVPPPPEAQGERRVAFQPESEASAATIAGLSPELSAEVARAEADHRAALTEPVERWRLEGVRARYEAVLKRATDPAATAAIQERLDRVARHEEVARAARTFQTLLERSRRRDHEVAVVRRQLAELDRPQRRPFVAEGLVQPSSKEVDGRRVWALIGPEGTPVAYLDVPPGLDARPVSAKRAGVRGSVRYNESLGARLIAVKDLEPLD